MSAVEDFHTFMRRIGVEREGVDDTSAPWLQEGSKPHAKVPTLEPFERVAIPDSTRALRRIFLWANGIEDQSARELRDRTQSQVEKAMLYKMFNAYSTGYVVGRQHFSKAVELGLEPENDEERQAWRDLIQHDAAFKAKVGSTAVLYLMEDGLPEAMMEFFRSGISTMWEVASMDTCPVASKVWEFYGYNISASISSLYCAGYELGVHEKFKEEVGL